MMNSSSDIGLTQEDLSIPGVPSATSYTSGRSVTFAEGTRVSFDKDDVEEEYDNILEDSADVPTGWDEGGKSHCGYPDSIHETLMSIGESMHSFFGEPNEDVQSKMRDVGNYFQEMSYAARDFQRGKLSVKEMTNVPDDDASSVDSAASDGEAGFQTITTVPWK